MLESDRDTIDMGGIVGVDNVTQLSYTPPKQVSTTFYDGAFNNLSIT